MNRTNPFLPFNGRLSLFTRERSMERSKIQINKYGTIRYIFFLSDYHFLYKVYYHYKMLLAHSLTHSHCQQQAANSPVAYSTSSHHDQLVPTKIFSDAQCMIQFSGTTQLARQNPYHKVPYVRTVAHPLHSLRLSLNLGGPRELVPKHWSPENKRGGS